MFLGFSSALNISICKFVTVIIEKKYLVYNVTFNRNGCIVHKADAAFHHEC